MHPLRNEVHFSSRHDKISFNDAAQERLSDTWRGSSREFHPWRSARSVKIIESRHTRASHASERYLLDILFNINVACSKERWLTSWVCKTDSEHFSSSGCCPRKRLHHLRPAFKTIVLSRVRTLWTLGIKLVEAWCKIHTNTTIQMSLFQMATPFCTITLC